MGLSQNTDLLHELQKDALVEPTEATQSPYMDDPAYAGFETLRGLFGAHHGENPAMYWLAQGKEMPEFATVADAQAAVWKDFRGKAQAYKAEQKRQQQAREALAATIDPLIDRYVRGDGVVPTPEQMTMMQQAGISWDSIRRARRGRQLVQEYDAQGALYDDRIINNLAEQVGDDEMARRIVLNMFYNDARKYAKDKHGDEWTGINWIDKAQQGSTGMLRTGGIRTARVAQRAWRNLQVLGEVDATANAAKRLPELIGSGMSQEEAYAQIEQDKKRLEIRRRWAADLVQTMEAGEQEYLESKDRHLVGRIGSQLGSIVGDTAPWFVPVIGPAIGASSTIQSRREEGASMRLDMEEAEKRAIMFGQADALEEMIAFSPIGRLTPGYKWLKKALGSGKAAEKLAPWRSKWLASPKVQYAMQGLSGAAEEAIFEPAAGYLMRTFQGMNLADERGKQTFRQYLNDMGQMMQGEQGIALLAYSFGMSGFNFPQIKKAAQEFGLSLQHYKELGGTEQGFMEARSEKTADAFLNKALSNLHDAWMENPQGAMERASVAAGKRLSRERIESLRELDAWRAAETAGMVPRVEPAEQEGMFRVYAPSAEKVRPKAPQEDTSAAGQQPESNQPSYTLMDGEQMTAYLQAFVSEQVENDILYTQNMLAGDVAVNQALAQKRFDAAEVITRTEADEQTGAERVVIAPETLGQMKARADMAMAAIRALEAEGVSYEEAAERMDASLSEHIPLGTLVQTWDEAQERIRTEQARNPEFKVPAMDAPFSRAYVTNVRRGDTFRRVLRYARGSATVEDLMEETMEQAVISWQAEQNTTWGEFGTMLQEAQKSINDLFPEARGKDMQFIHLDAGKPVTGHDAIEAFSKIGRSRWLADALNHPSLPSWLRKLLNHLVKFLGAFKARVELGEMVRQAEEQGVFTLPVRQALAVMLDAGNALYRDQQGDLISLTMERAKAQAELDAALGRGVATEQEAVEEQLAERNAADEPGPVDRAQEEADDANAQQARRERTEAEVITLGEQDDDGVFVGGVSIRIEDGVRQGFIDKDRLTLCPDVPQFKQGADEKTGVVNRIVGAWQRNAAPISVWRRTDGSLQVISGRHRLDACTDADINCTVYEEGERFNLDWARRHDVENNIRDGQASAFEIARYVRDSSLSMAEAVERGIARKGASLKGVELGLYASQELLDALGNGLVSADDAYRVALAFRNDAEVQRSGLAVLLDGGSWQESYNTMAAKANLEAIARQNAANGMDMGMDLFGNTDNEELYKRIGKYAAEKYRELGKELTAINGASRNPKVARKYGVNVNDAAAVQQVAKRLQEERARWKNFAVHPDLLKEANDAVMVEMGLKSKEDVDRENGVLPLEDPEQEAESADQGTLMLSQDVSRMLDDFMNRGNTHFSLAGENEALLAPNGKPSNLAPEQYRQVRTPEFKKWFGDWEKVATFKDAYERIMTMPPVTALTGQEFQKDGVPLTEKVTKLWKERFNGVAISPELGEVRLDLEGVKSSIGHGIGSLKSAAFACVEDVIRNGVVFDRQANWKGRGYDTAVIAAPVTIKDVEYICEVVVEQRSNRQGFYLHEVEIKKKLEDVFKTSTEGGTPQASRSILALRAEDVKREEENMSKVVDENGEPLVVYHGTRGDFTVFNIEKAGSSNKYSKVGFWFSTVEGFGERWLENSWWGNGQEKVLSLFLNLRNPKVFESNKERYGDAFEQLRTDVVSLIGMDAEFANIGGVGKAWYKETERGLAPEFMTSDEIDSVFREYREKLRDEGYDGVFIRQTEYDYDIAGGTNDQYVAFDSAQVKSATDNRGAFDGENPDITFSIRTEDPPKNTGIGYKVFYRGKDGKLYPPMVANPQGKETPVGVWLDADEGVRAGVSKTGRPRVKAGGKGTQGGSGTLAYRPGWHLGEIPYALQFNRRNPQTGERDLFPPDFVWAEVEYAADHDYQEEAMSHGINPSGKFQHSLAGLPRIPKDGFYKYRTNPNPQTDPWIITGAIKVRRILSKAEVDDIVRKAGREPQVTFSIIGEKAESFMDYHNNGLSYTDPADGKRKAIIDSRGVRLKKERISVSEGGHVNVSLAAALDFPELFRAYPELRKLRVDFYRDSKSSTGGFTDPQENYIAVNLARGGKNAAPGMVLDTILHEVQHVIQWYEGFAVGAGNMSREQALAYLSESMNQLQGRGDDWAKEALPRLERMKRKLEEGTLQPPFVYIFSHGEQEARLAGSFNRNSEGVVMSGLNGFRLLDAPMFSIPLTGNVTELGGITFGAGRFGRMAHKVLAPNGDWLYDEMVFKMRAATQRSVNKLNLYETGDRERGLELLAEAQELISTVERFLPNTYGFGLEPYKIWLNVFSLLYGNSGKMAPDEALASALGAIPMEKWPEIMTGSVMKHFWLYVEQDETLGPVWEGKMKEFEEEAKFAEAGEKAAELDKRRWEFFVANGAEFLEKYGQVKVYRLIGKFMERVVEQIDRYRKDRTLGRIRRVVASVAPRTNPKGKPMLGKMDAEAHRRLEKCMRLLEMTESQYDEFFQKNFPEDAEEGKRWEDLAPDALVQVTLPDADGKLEEVAVTQREFEIYACYERMDVNTAEKCGAALGEFVSTSRHAWENAAEKKKLEVAAMAAPVLQATGELDDNRMAKFRRKARLRALPKKPLSLFDYLMNFNQYMQALSSVEPFAAIAAQFEERAARFNVQRQASEKDMLGFVHNTVAEIAGSADRYDIAEWIYEGRVKQDTGITVVEREPDWKKKANALYRERFLHLLRRKVKSHGLEAVQLYLREFKLSEDLKKEVNALFGHRRKEITAKQAEKALKHMESVFTQKEWERYGEQEVFVRERAEMLRSRTKYAKEGYEPKSYRLDGLSRMEAAYLVLLSEQADYTEALAERGFDAAVMDQLREFAGDEVMRFAYQLREKLNERSGQVQEMTERRYGTPFPLTENYFRAFFDVTMEAIDKSIADAASYGEAATGGKYGMIHARRKHKAHLDLEMDVCTAFMAAMTEQDLYLYGSEISRDLRALLNFRGEAGEAGRSLEVLLGRDAVGKLMAWADAFDRAGAESIRGHLDMNRLMNRLSGAAARVLLSGRVGTLTKQATTVINAMYASDEINLAEWLGAVRRYHAGKLVKPVSEIEALPELDSRDKTQFSATLAAMGADEAGRRVSRLERWNREGMDLLERVDMKGNAISAAILYDAVYRKAKRETPDATEAELDAVAMAEVRRSLSRKGQPMTPLQKSLAAQTRTWMQAGMLFLGGESINTIGNVFSLARSGQWGKAGLMWISHGMVLAILNGLLNFMTDDEKRRRKREWWHALFDVVMGPVMGIPVVSGLAGEGVRQLAKLCGYNAFMPGNNLLVPFSNAADIGKAFSNAWKVFDGKERPWEDDALSFHELLRTAAAGTVAFSPRTTKGGAAAVGAALTMAALLNVAEFTLKTVRSVQENGVDWDKWTGSRK